VGSKDFRWCLVMILWLYLLTRKYTLRGCILGSGVPGTPGVMGVTLRAFLSPLRHMEQLLLVTSCDSPAGIGASLRIDAQTTDKWTHRRDVGNSILDFPLCFQCYEKWNWLLLFLCGNCVFLSHVSLQITYATRSIFKISSISKVI